MPLFARHPFALRPLACALAVTLGIAGAAHASGTAGARSASQAQTGNVIFFHPDGAGANHWNAARMWFNGPDGATHWDQLPNMALYRGHMINDLVGTSHGGATTHAFGARVDAFGSFGKDGDGSANPPTDRFINSLSGFSGSLMRQAANAGIPVGLVNDGHIGEPGTGAFLAEVGNRNNWQEITKQMIMGRPGMNDTAPWVIMGGGEADTLPQGTPLLHRNHNEERRQPLNAQTSLRTDTLNLQDHWNRLGTGNTSNAIGTDDAIVIRTRAEFEQLRTALAQNPRYAPRVLGLFAYQDLFNDRNEEDLVARGKVTADAPMHVGAHSPASPNLAHRAKMGRIVLWGDVTGNPGHNPPTFAEMTQVALTILERAAAQQRNRDQQRFYLVAEQESIDNFGNNNNAIGTLHALRDTDLAIGVAREFLQRQPRTLIVTAADSDAGGLQVASPRGQNVACVAPQAAGVTAAPTVDTTNFGNFQVNTATGSATLMSVADGIEGRGSDQATGAMRSFLTEPDQNGRCHPFGIVWSGLGDYGGGIISRAAGINAQLLNTPEFATRFDNIDVYRIKHHTLFGGRMLADPSNSGSTLRPGAAR